MTKESDRTKARLMDAALIVFAERGFARSTTEQICGLAKANAAAVCYHFSDKLGIYKTILRCAERALADSWAATRLAGSAENELRVYIRQMMVYTTDPSALYLRVVMHELCEPTAARAILKDVIRLRTTQLVKIVANMIGHSADSPRTRLAAASIMSQITHCFTARPVLESLWPGIDDEAKSGRLTSHVEQFCCHALTALRCLPS